MKVYIRSTDFTAQIPSSPGVYKYFDAQDVILYVGKAKNLKKRVSSYFVKKHLDAKTQVLVKKIHAIEVVVVDSEIDALLLENNLIKQYQPRYNILLKDDKTFPWLCIKNEPFPRLFSTRKKINDGSKYFGPYPKGRSMHVILNLIRELYPLRTCHLDLSDQAISAKKHKVCLEFHLKRCLGPCENIALKEAYKANIQDIEWILSGKTHSLIQLLKGKMQEAAEILEFEKAEIIKRNINAIQEYRSSSTIVNDGHFNIDVLTLVNKEHVWYFNYLWVREGHITFTYSDKIEPKLNETESELAPTLLQHLQGLYGSQEREIVSNLVLDDALGPYRFVLPKIGPKAKIVEWSLKNIQLEIIQQLKTEIKPTNPPKSQVTLALQEALGLKNNPIHIECFDNSNIQGTSAVAACVVFKHGVPSKKEYRHFNIKTVVGPDDFASMTEIVFRRYKRLLEEGGPLPDLIIIDGGKGQLSAALQSIDRLNLRGKIAIMGLAKRLEEIYWPEQAHPMMLDKTSEAMKLVQHLRNEAHRFGISHHRNQRSANFIQSELEQIKGIGPATIAQLFQTFKTLGAIKSATINQLEACVGEAKAKIIKDQQ